MFVRSRLSRVMVSQWQREGESYLGHARACTARCWRWRMLCPCMLHRKRKLGRRARKCEKATVTGV
eukprot:6196129-Pleurochrysis_carterae.AAC.4